ncbi:pyridoxal phosphate-dependent enzyme, beta subunit, partial [Gonapodya prolifera JEL478]
GIADGIEEMIGNTPLVRIRSLSDATGCDILGKAEFLNPGGSSKDRVALSILLHAEKQGLITPHSGCVVFEGTVGSTGIALAVVCRARGYGCHIVMPNDQANEKYAVLEALGAVVEKVRPSSIVDPTHYVNLARRRAQEFTKLHATASAKPSYPSPRGLFADQFDTPANRAAHTSTADEVWRQTQGKIDAFVMGAGTGGTLAGVGQRLKKRTMGRVKVVCADPQGSAIHNRITHGVMFSETEREGHRGRHQVDSIVEGIGLNRVTGNLVAALDSAGAETLGGKWIDGSEKVTDEEAAWMARWLVEHDGLWVGSSSCVNLVGAVRVARKLRREREHVGDRRKVVVVTVLCDSGARGASRFWNK